MKRPLEIIGETDIADLPELGWHNVPVRVDSGAATSAIHCSRVKVVDAEGAKELHVYLDANKGAPKHFFIVTDFKQTVIRNSFGKEEKRFVIKTPIRLFGRKIRTEFTLANRQKMSFPILLGRKLLKNRFIIDVSKKNLSAARHSQTPTRSHT